MKMRVLFLTLYDEIAASSRTRVYVFVPHLEKEGVICAVKPLFIGGSSTILQYLFAVPKRFLHILSAWRYDLVFIQKDIFPWILRKLLYLLNKRVVYEFDDAIFTTNDKGLKGWIMQRRAKNFPEMLKLAKHVVIENEYNRAFVLEHCKNTSIITGPIDTERYFPINRTKSGKITIGWIGSPSTVEYLTNLNPIFEKLMICHKDKIKLKIIGSDKELDLGIETECVKWDLDTEVQELQSFDIGIMPLPDNEWTRGKGGYKLLQYMSCGLPVVASPVGVNCEIVNKQNGFLAKDEEEWYKALDSLIKNSKLREKLGANGRKLMEERYSLKLAVQEYLKIFKSLTGDRND